MGGRKKEKTREESFKISPVSPVSPDSLTVSELRLGLKKAKSRKSRTPSIRRLYSTSYVPGLRKRPPSFELVVDSIDFITNLFEVLAPTERFLPLPEWGASCPHCGLSREEIDSLGVDVFIVKGRPVVYWHQIKKAVFRRKDRRGRDLYGFLFPRKFADVLASFESCRLEDVPDDAKVFSGPYTVAELPRLKDAVSALTERHGADVVLLAYTRQTVRIFIREKLARKGGRR